MSGGTWEMGMRGRCRMCFFFRQKTANEISLDLVGSGMGIRDKHEAGLEWPANK